MPTTPNLQDIVLSERTNILNKAILRTALMEEKNFPAVAEDARPAQVVAYEHDVYDNKESPLFGDDKAAQLWSVIQGFGAQKFSHETADAKSVTVGRGAVIVPVNRRYFKWSDASPDVVADAKGVGRLKDAYKHHLMIDQPSQIRCLAKQLVEFLHVLLGEGNEICPGSGTFQERKKSGAETELLRSRILIDVS